MGRYQRSSAFLKWERGSFLKACCDAKCINLIDGHSGVEFEKKQALVFEKTSFKRNPFWPISIVYM